MIKYIVVSVLVVLALVLLLLPVPEHQIIINYVDGSSKSLSISHNDKAVESITYKTNNLDTSLYEPYFSTPFGNIPIEPNQTIPIYQLVNYNLEDGTYIITLVPDGQVTRDGEIITLEEITFSITVLDDRFIDITFG